MQKIFKLINKNKNKSYLVCLKGKTHGVFNDYHCVFTMVFPINNFTLNFL